MALEFAGVYSLLNTSIPSVSLSSSPGPFLCPCYFLSRSLLLPPFLDLSLESKITAMIRDFSSSQCKKFRDQLSPKQVQTLREKLCASELFKGKKASYPQR